MLIIGCDFHTRTQQMAMLDTETGEVVEHRLEHESGEAKRFYEGLKERALVGIESTGSTRWFAAMLAEWGHELVVGDAAKIRAMEPRKQKHDRRDAQHLLNLLARGDFPRLWLPSVEERDVRVLLEHRHQLVQLRTRVKNGLQAIALNYGLARRAKLWTVRGIKELAALPLREGMARRRGDLVPLLAQPDAWIGELDKRLEQEAEQREAAQSASRCDPGLKRVYRRLAFRNGSASAKVAVARKLIIRLYIMLRDQIDYEEFCRRGSHAGMLGDVALA
ncbi:MAG: transposase [Acidobacteriia bacterium]|nr:transposase [Terriglobia bacterium]